MSDLMGGFMHAIETINAGPGPSSSHVAHPGAGIGKAAEAYEVGFRDGKDGQVGVCYPAPYESDYERGFRDGKAAHGKGQNGSDVDDGTGLTLAQQLAKDYENDPRPENLKSQDPKYKNLGGGFPEEPGGPDDLDTPNGPKYGNTVNFGHTSPADWHSNAKWFENMYD